jgi:hypothetical protein
LVSVTPLAIITSAAGEPVPLASESVNSIVPLLSELPFKVSVAPALPLIVTARVAPAPVVNVSAAMPPVSVTVYAVPLLGRTTHVVVPFGTPEGDQFPAVFQLPLVPGFAHVDVPEQAAARDRLAAIKPAATTAAATTIHKPRRTGDQRTNVSNASTPMVRRIARRPYTTFRRNTKGHPDRWPFAAL